MWASRTAEQPQGPGSEVCLLWGDHAKGKAEWPCRAQESFLGEVRAPQQVTRLVV